MISGPLAGADLQSVPQKTLFLAIGALVLLLNTSCRIYGVRSGYSSLTSEEREFVRDYSQMDIRNAETGFIHQITPENLLTAMHNYQYNVIYLWHTRCSSESFVPVYVAVREAEKRGYRLWVLLFFYDPLIIGIDFGVPLYVVKSGIYRTDRNSRITHRFFTDLGWEQERGNWGPFFIFHHSNFVSRINSIFDLPEVSRSLY